MMLAELQQALVINTPNINTTGMGNLLQVLML
jgi:hypothetical protein